MNDSVITEDVLMAELYINKTWPQFTTKVEVPLNELFPQPENKGLAHIWKYGSADLTVWKNGKLRCVIEIGGSHHWEEKQSLNDRRKWKLCDVNGVRCLTMMNGVQDSLSKRKWRRLLGSHLFGSG